MRSVTVVVLAAALFTSACGAAVENSREAAGSRADRGQHCDGRSDAQSGTNFADCGPTQVHIRFDQPESPGAAE